MASDSNLYNIGIRMTMTDNVSPMLTALAGHFLHLHHNINHATAAAQRFRMAVAGAVAAFAGVELGRGVAHLVEAGNRLINVQQQMGAQGWLKNPGELAAATEEAYRLSAKYQMVAPGEFLEMIKEIAPAVGSREHAVELADLLGRFNVAARIVLGEERGAGYSRMIQEAVKSGELSGAILQPKIFEKYLDAMARGLKAFGGTITPHDYMMAMRGGKAAALNWSPEFINSVLPTLMQEMGAPNAGNALLQMYAAIVGGRMWKYNALAFDELGLIDRSKWDATTPEGRPKRPPAGSVLGWQLFATDPDKWMWQYLMPAMVKSGKISPEQLEEIKKGNIKEGSGHEAMLAVTKEFANLFGRQTAQQVADVLALQIYKITRDKRLIGDAMGLDEGVKFFKENSLEYAVESFKAQWEGLMQTLGAPSVRMATRALQQINSALTQLVVAAHAHPTAAKVLVATLAGLAAGLVVIGIAMLALAALGGGALIAVLLVGLATGLGALALIKWDKVKQAGFLLKTYFVATWDNLANQVNAIADRLKQVTDKIRSAIETVIAPFNRLADVINKLGAVLGLFNAFGGAAGKIEKQSYVPSSAQQGGARTIRISLNIDGRVMGEAVASYIAKGSQWMGSSADFDGMRAATPADWSPAI